MAREFQIRGGAELKALSRQLRKSDRELSKDLRRGLSRAVKPAVQKVKAQSPTFLPDRYAEELMADLRVTRRFMGGRDVRMVLTGTARGRRGKRRDLASLNRGRLRKPLFGDRRHWYDQRVRTDWWDHPLISWAPEARREMERVLADVKRKLERGKAA